MLWNNKDICIDGKTIYNNSLANMGIRIGDLVSEDNKLITKYMVRELNITPLHAFKLTRANETLPRLNS